jgi:uncharacterized RDD family membrane protein YckC
VKWPRLRRATRASTQATPARLRGSNRDRIMLTPEGIALPITVASRGSRAGALLLDLGLIIALMIGTTLALIAIAGGTFGLLGQAGDRTVIGQAMQFLVIVWLAAVFLFRNAYFLFFELGPRGATPGKRITGIRIAARDGGRLTAEMVIARNLLRDIELFVPVVLVASLGDQDETVAGIAAALWFLIFALMPLFNRDRLRAGDIIAGSWVVEAPRRKLEPVMSLRREEDEAGTAQEQFMFTDAELAVYGEYELQTLERLLRESRKDALEAVHRTIAAKLGREAYWGQERPFLEAYYRQLRARLEAGLRMGRRKADKFE